MRHKRVHPAPSSLLYSVCVTVIVCSCSLSIGAPRGKAVVKTDTLEVHAAATPDSKVVKSLKKDESVSIAYEILGVAGAWCAIAEEEASPMLGFVPCRHLERKAPSTVWHSTGTRIIKAAPTPPKMDRPVKILEKGATRSSGVTAILYMVSWCPYCRKARECLQSLGVNLIEYDIEKDGTREAEMRTKGWREGVPFIDIDGIYLSGYSEEAIKRAVEKRRRS